uniref:Oxygen-independent coproporphyrinogen III oxidase n=1 Tax=Paramoeba pemaquidensis TaxID=180228 RepID=A0A161HS61_9EUKA|nr:oxygen-independent coproporphyrinogen III oxidase [Paramoeba pemaquidensis]
METTPSIAASQPAKMAHLANHGVRRISIGVQSTNSTLLSEANRTAQIKAEVEAISNLRKAGFDRVSTDVIFGLPGQSMDDWKQDLKVLVELGPDAITTYDCLYRGKGRPFRKSVKEKQSIPSPERYGEMYDHGYNFLLQNGYFAPYGSVNFSKKEGDTGTSAYFEKRLLWGSPYVGLGNYASSLLDRYWIFGPYTVDAWLDAVREKTEEELLSSWPIHDAYSLGREERVAKHALLSLSFGFLDCSYFEKAFPGCAIEDFYGDVLQYLVEEKGWMVFDRVKRRYLLREGVFDKLHIIRALFYSARCLSWFERKLEEK